MNNEPIIRNYKDSVENRELVWVPLSDGRKLAARIVLPKKAVENPVPVILEYLPYRRRDGTRARDEINMYWFAANGYAFVRLDISGTGDSDGLVEDEYVKREQDDGIEAIAWLADQDWCSGSVGMIGISWGGFNGLQIAVRQPPALKAVISLCSTVDRYNDDVHYMGGCQLNDNMDWGSAFFTFGGLPPDPKMVGKENWEDIWKKRLAGLKLYPALWLEHQRRDDFWKHGSVQEDYSSIKTPVLAVSGWADGYPTAVFKLVENMRTTCKGIIGPWGHKYPNQGVPGPAIGFLQECKRWWDHWLKDIDTGVDQDPDMRLFLQNSEKPAPHFDNRSGRWLGIPEWPANGIVSQRYFLKNDTLRHATDSVPEKEILKICSPQTTGVSGGEWCAYGLGKVAPELPIDQRQDDSGSITFDGEPLSEPLRIIGEGSIKLKISADQAQALIAVRLNNIYPNGSVERISYGVLNLAHRNGSENPTKLVPNKFYNVSLKLKGIAQTIPSGNKLRISVSTSYWPLLWPSPTPATISVDTSGSYVNLPILCDESGFEKTDFEPPEHATPLNVTVKSTGTESRSLTNTFDDQSTQFVVRRDDGSVIIDDIGTELSYTKEKVFSIERDDPISCTSEFKCSASYKRKDWDAKIETSTKLSSDKLYFYIVGSVKAFNKGKLLKARNFSRTIKRDNM
jgi:putative CocE/NonD family hydrolase